MPINQDDVAPLPPPSGASQGITLSIAPSSPPAHTNWFWAIFAGAIVGTISIYFILFLAMSWMSPPLDGMLSNISGMLPASPPKHQLSTSEKALIGKLFERGNIIGMDTIVSSLINYYNNLIIILLGLVAAACALSVMYIKAASNAHAEDVAERATEKTIKTYFKSTNFRDLTDARISVHTKKKLAEMNALIEEAGQAVEKAEEISSQVGERLRRIEARLAELDTNESGEGGNITSSNPRPEEG